MWLSSIVDGLEYIQVLGNLQVEITAVTFDSREVSEGSLFVAIAGFETDGHTFIHQAIERGAIAVVLEKEVEVEAGAGVTVLRVQDSRDALAQISAAFYGDPTTDINLVGVTGTNGKTTITYFIQSILKQDERSVGLIGTMGSLINGEAVKTFNTTPESLHLQQLFARMREAGVSDCVMEVSSHALSLKRTAYSRFRTGIFTNLTPDHLELHHSMESYFEAKSKLFDMTTDTNIINGDDPYGQLLLARLQGGPAKIISYGIDPQNDVFATQIRCTEEGTRCMVHTPAGNIQVQLHIPGMINVYNALAAIAYGVSQGISLSVIQRGLDHITGVRGRLETVYQDPDHKVIVDFAHTEDGLEKVLLTLRPFVSGRIILVFGVYGAEGVHGERKRRAMGKVAGTYADLSIVTSDNPKFQNPVRIIHEIVRGVKQAGGAYHSFVDRQQAIQYALSQCGKGDVVLIAGKGHETTQILGSTAVPFNEREIVKAFMSSGSSARAE